MGYIGRTPTGSILTSADIADGSISTAKLEDNAVTTAKIIDNAVTAAKYVEYPAYRNLIINGDMSIAQRGTSVAGITTTGYKTLDRFYLNIANNGTYTMSQDTDVPSGQGFGKSLKLSVTTADASLTSGSAMLVEQKFEGQNLQQLKKGTSNAESLTLSFWVKSNKTGTYICEIDDNDNSRNINKSYTIDSADTWEKKTITFAGDTTGTLDNDNGYSVRTIWWLSAGTAFTSGTLATSWESTTNANRAVGQVNLSDSTSNYINITGVQLEVGTSASDFEFLPFDVNLQRCQRYYHKTYNLSDAPASVTSTGILDISGFSDGSNNLLFDIPHKVRMRGTPTVTYYNSGGTSGQWFYGRNGASGNNTATSYSGRTAENNLSTYVNIGASWTGGFVAGHYTLDAEL